MLLGKPLYKKYCSGRSTRRHYEQTSDELLGDDISQDGDGARVVIANCCEIRAVKND